MDNGSTDPYTLALLKTAKKKGACLYWGYDTPHDFHNKGGHFGNIIKHWDAEHKYDYALPVDCDELLSVFTRTGISTSANDIHEELERLNGTRCTLRIDMSLFNIPERTGWFAPVRHFHKGFLPSNALEILDNGHHEPVSRLEPGYRSTRLTYLHHHNRPFDAWRAMIKRKLNGRVDTSDESALLAYEAKPGAEGVHLIRSLFMSREEYVYQYAKELQIHAGIGEGKLTLLNLPGNNIEIWDNNAYLAVNPDVTGYDLTALHHYIRYGFLEGRTLA